MNIGKRYRSVTGKWVRLSWFRRFGLGDDRLYIGVFEGGADGKAVAGKAVGLTVQQADELATEIAAWVHARRVEEAIAAAAGGAR